MVGSSTSWASTTSSSRRWSCSPRGSSSRSSRRIPVIARSCSERCSPQRVSCWRPSTSGDLRRRGAPRRTKPRLCRTRRWARRSKRGMKHSAVSRRSPTAPGSPSPHGRTMTRTWWPAGPPVSPTSVAGRRRLRRHVLLRTRVSPRRRTDYGRWRGKPTGSTRRRNCGRRLTKSRRRSRRPRRTPRSWRTGEGPYRWSRPSTSWARGPMCSPRRSRNTRRP